MSIAGEPREITLLIVGWLDLHSVGALARCSKGLWQLINECTEYRSKREAFDAAASGDFGPAIRGDMLDVLRCVVAHPDGLRNLIPLHPDECHTTEKHMDDVSVLLQQYRSFLDNKRVGKMCYAIRMPQFPHLHILFYIDWWCASPGRMFIVTLRQNLRWRGGPDMSKSVYLYQESIASP